MIQAACCCGFCKSSCAHRFYHTWTLQIKTTATTEFFASKVGGTIGGPVGIPIPDTLGSEVVVGKKTVVDERNFVQAGTAYYTQGSRLKISGIEGANPTSLPQGCTVSFAGIPDLATSGDVSITTSYEETKTEISRYEEVTVCERSSEDVVTMTKDGRGAFNINGTGEGLECMNDTYPWIIPTIGGKTVSGDLLAYRADGSDPNCHPPNPGIRTGYSECRDAIGVHDFSGQQRFTIEPYEGMEEDTFYFRRWKATPLLPQANNQFYLYDELAETYVPVSRNFDMTYSVEGGEQKSAGCPGGPSDTTTTFDDQNRFTSEMWNIGVGGGLFPGGGCGFRDHLLGIWSAKNGEPPADPFGVNCANSGPDPETWEGGSSIDFPLPTAYVSDPTIVPFAVRQGIIGALDEIGCPCTFPTPVPCDGNIDISRECPSDPEQPTTYPMVTVYSAWKALGGNATGPSDIDVTFPYYQENFTPGSGGIPDRTDIYSGTFRYQIEYRWNLNVSDVVTSYDNAQIEAPCR